MFVVRYFLYKVYVCCQIFCAENMFVVRNFLYKVYVCCQIFCAEWSPDGRYLATMCKDGKLRVFDPRQSLQPIKVKYTMLHKKAILMFCKNCKNW